MARLCAPPRWPAAWRANGAWTCSTSTPAAPLARSLARERGVDLLRLRGSGPGGRIVGRDVPATSTSSPGGADTKPKPKLHLHWWRHGKVPVLLLYGFCADHASWRPLVEQLPPEILLAGVDLPCHGKSPVQSAGSMQAMAQAVLDRLEQEGIAACHLLGHSLGGGVALALAAAQPQRVRSLSLLAPAGLGPEINGEFIDGLTRAQTQAALTSTLALLLHDPAALTGSFVATAFHLLQAPARRAALSGMAFQLMPGGIQQQNLRRELDALPMPTKLIWGIADRIIPASHGAGVPGGVALHLLPGVGHLPQVEATTLGARLLQHRGRAGAAAWARGRPGRRGRSIDAPSPAIRPRRRGLRRSRYAVDGRLAHRRAGPSMRGASQGAHGSSLESAIPAPGR